MRPKHVKTQELARELHNLAAMLQAGIPPARALTGVGQSHRDQRLLRAAALVEQDLSLDKALEHEGFPALVVAMAATGIQSGGLADAVQQAAVQYEQQAKLERAIFETLLYPKLVTAAVVGAVGALGLTAWRGARQAKGSAAG